MADQEQVPDLFQQQEGKRTWVDVQKKTFTGWANSFLSERLLKIEDMETSLQDGVLLINLLEIISAKKIGWNARAKMRVQKVENCGTAVNFIEREGIKLVGIGAEDIVDGKLKLILGLIWTLILRYQIQQGIGEGSPKRALLDWVNKQVKPYGKVATNFKEDWQDGTLLSALADSLEPGCVLNDRDLGALSGDHTKDIDRAMDVSEDTFDIPKILDARDMAEFPEELSNITYISYFRDWLENDAERKRKAEEAERLRLLNTADPAACFAYGPGLESPKAHEDNPFTIQTVNWHGDELKHGGENFTVTVKNKETGEKTPATVSDNGDGTYPVVYRPTAPGETVIKVKMNASNIPSGSSSSSSSSSDSSDDEGKWRHIKDSPFHVNVVGADAGQCNAYGPGLAGGNIGKPAEFHIQARDGHGNPIKGGGDEFLVVVTGPEDLGKQEVKDKNDGTYDCVYHPTKMGTYTVDISLRGEPIADSPFSVLIQAGVAGNSWAEGPGLEGASTGHPAEFTIHSVDCDGNPRSEGGDPFEVELTGPEDQKAQVTDNGDGTYTCVYNVDKPGDYTINTTLHGDPIKDMPVQVHVKPSSSAENSYAEGPGLEEVFDNEETEFTIHSVDADGNPVTNGGEDFDVKIRGPEDIDAKVTDNGDGTYTVKYEPNVPGDYTVDTTLEGRSIKDMPKSIEIKQGTDASNSKVSFAITVQSMDKRKQPKTVGGDKFTVDVEKNSDDAKDVLAEARDNGDGTYTAAYTLKGQGKWKVYVKLNGKNVKGSPFKQNNKQ